MEKHKLPFHKISAKSGEGIQALFFSVVDMINENQLQKQKKFKNKEEQESHGGQLTEKPLRVGQK